MGSKTKEDRSGTYETSQNALEEAPLVGTHKRSKSWAATVEADPNSPGGLSREWWEDAGGDWHYQLPLNLEVGDVVEFAGDYYTTSGNKRPKRVYAVVEEIGDDYLEAGIYDKSDEAFEAAEDVNEVEINAENPDVAEAAHRLRRELANWRDSVIDTAADELLDQLADDYDAVEEIAIRYESG